MGQFLKRFTLNALTRFLFLLMISPIPLLSIRVTCLTSSRGILRKGGTGAAIVLSKHQHYFDIIALVMALWRRLDFIAKTELFEGRVARWYFEGTSCIEVKRGDREALKALREAGKRLVEKMVVLFFAEGTRRPGNNIDKIEGGVLTTLKLLLRDNPYLLIPIIPVGLHYGRKDFYFIPIWTIDVWIGSPFFLSECGSTDEEIIEHFRAAMQRAQDNAVRQARNRGARSVYNTRAAND